MNKNLHTKVREWHCADVCKKNVPHRQVSCFCCYFAVETTALVSEKHVTFLSYLLLIFFLGIYLVSKVHLWKNWVCGSFGTATCNVSCDYELVNFSDVYMFMQNIFPSGALFPCSLRTKNSSIFIEKSFIKMYVFQKNTTCFCPEETGRVQLQKIQYKQRYRKCSHQVLDEWISLALKCWSK